MHERILVIDDEEVVLNAVRKALGQENYRIDTVQTAAEALQLLKTSSYDLVITDLMMPELDGVGLLARMREAGVETPSVVITGYPTVQTALFAKRLGTFEYVTKPFTRQELRSVVARAIRTQRNEAAGEDAPTASGSLEPFYRIPEHAWARLDPDGAVRVGMARAFALVVGDVVSVVLPAKDDWLEQGRACALVRAADSMEHSFYSPVSGWVLEVNPAVVEEPALAVREPEHQGWLLRIRPQNLDRDLSNLSPP